MKEGKPGSRVVNQAYARAYPANAFSLAMSQDDAQLVFGLLDTDDSQTLLAEGRVFITLAGIRALHELLGHSLARLEHELKAGRTAQ